MFSSIVGGSWHLLPENVVFPVSYYYNHFEAISLVGWVTIGRRLVISVGFLVIPFVVRSITDNSRTEKKNEKPYT